MNCGKTGGFSDGSSWQNSREKFHAAIAERRAASVGYAKIIAAAMGVVGGIHTARAATFSWSGLGADSNWQTPANWTPNTGIATGSNLMMLGTTQLTNNNNFAGGSTFSTITFAASAGQFVLGGNALVLNAGSAAAVVNNSTALETIDLPLTLTGGRTIDAAAGPISIEDALTGTAGIFYGVNPSLTTPPPTSLSVVILNSAGTYSTASTSTAATTIDSGTLQIGAGGSLPSSASTTLATGWVALGNTTNNSSGILELGDSSTPVNQTINRLAVLGTGAGNAVIGGNSAISTLTINYLVTGGSESFGGTIGGSGTNQNNLALVISGGNTVAFSGVNTYVGNTTITAGTMTLGAAGSIADSPIITVGSAASSAAKFNVNAVTGGFTLASGQTLTGGGTVVGALTVGTGSTLSPGNNVGTLVNTGNVKYGPSGSYLWQINNTAGTEGADPGWDTQTITGGLTITATAGSPFNIDLESLTTADVAGSAANFNKLQSYSWDLATTTTGVTNFAASDFNINTTGFANSSSGSSQNGSFGVAVVGNNLELTYSPAINTTATTYSLVASVAGGSLANGRLTQGQSTTVSSSITNTGAGSADTLDYTNLNASASSGTLAGGTLPKASGGPLAQGASDSGSTTFTAATSGTVSIIPLVGTASNGTIGGSASLSGSTSASVTVDALIEHTTQFLDTGAAATSSTAAYRQNYVAGGNLGSVTVTQTAPGNYLPGYLDNINSGAGVSIGTVTVNLVGGSGSFAPDASIALLDFTGVSASNDPAALTKLESDLQTLGYTYVDRFGNTDASLSTANLAAFTTASRDYDLEILFNPGPASTPSYLDFDFSNPNYAGIGNVVNIAVVPEPASSGLLVAATVAGLALRKRRTGRGA